MEILNAALNYAKRGWPVFPLRPSQKTPMVLGGFHKATTNLDQIRSWWSNWPNANVAVAANDKSFCVIDIDPKNGGDETYMALREEFGAFPETLSQRTGGGGVHYLFKHHPAVGSTAGKLGPGMDTRGNDKGYIVVAPSLHENGKAYEWINPGTPLADIPEWVLNILANGRPKQEEPQDVPFAPPETTTNDKPRKIPQDDGILDRAREYLRHCEPAVQGQGGHAKLLWACTAMVWGFELSGATAYGLLAEVYNPMCSPPWDLSDAKDEAEFRRKVREGGKNTAKPRGWLLEGNLDPVAVQEGAEIAEALLAEINPPSDPADLEWEPFPTDLFPEKVADYIRKVAIANIVDESFVAIPVIVTAGAAMGNAFRLKIKPGFIAAPVFWCMVIGSPGANKSSPIVTVVRPLRNELENPYVSTGIQTVRFERMVLGDATIEAVIDCHKDSRRGILMHFDEMRSWFMGFGAYKRKSEGDEAKWLQLYEGREYSLDRKSNSEHVDIPAASVSIIGGIQPGILQECFDPTRFASGLLPRLCPVWPPYRLRQWTEVGIPEGIQAVWDDIVSRLRYHPYASGNGDLEMYKPNIILLSQDAKKAFGVFFDETMREIETMSENDSGIYSKSTALACRVALIIHGLEAVSGQLIIPSEAGLDAMERGIQMARWLRREAVRVFRISSKDFRAKRARVVLEWIKAHDRHCTIRELQHSHNRRYRNADSARVDLQMLVDMNYGFWKDRNTFGINHG